MSAIASFYLIDDEKRDDLIEAAQAQSRALTKKRWGVLRPKFPLNPDPFWSFISSNARELEEFPYSGWLFCDIELLAPGALSSDDEVGKRVSQITDSTFVSYRPSDTPRTINLLRAADFSEDRIQKFLTEEGREDNCPETVAAIRDSVNRFIQWLQAVAEGKTGVLHVG